MLEQEKNNSGEVYTTCHEKERQKKEKKCSFEGQHDSLWLGCMGWGPLKDDLSWNARKIFRKVSNRIRFLAPFSPSTVFIDLYSRSIIHCNAEIDRYIKK